MVSYVLLRPLRPKLNIFANNFPTPDPKIVNFCVQIHNVRQLSQPFLMHNLFQKKKIIIII
jgi:hypothetical protein